MHDPTIIVFTNECTWMLHIKPFGKRHPDLYCVMRKRWHSLRHLSHREKLDTVAKLLLACLKNVFYLNLHVLWWTGRCGSLSGCSAVPPL